MPHFLFIPLVFMLSFIGHVYFILSQDKHASAILEASPSLKVRRASRWVAWGSLLVSMLLGIALDGFAFGLLIWFFLTALAVLLAAVTLAYRPHWLRRFAF